MVNPTYKVSLPKNPTTYEKFILFFARISLWIALYIIMVATFLTTGISETVLSSFQKLPALNNITGTLTLNTTHTKAEVLLDGLSIGETPVKNYTLSEGPYSVMLKPKTLYNFLKPLSFPIVIKPGSATIVKAQLGVNDLTSSYFNVYSIHSNTNNLVIYTEPTNVKIFLNQRYVGNTPIIINDYPAGNYKIELKKEGYKPLTLPITLTNSSTVLIKAKLYKFVLQ